MKRGDVGYYLMLIWLIAVSVVITQIVINDREHTECDYIRNERIRRLENHAWIPTYDLCDPEYGIYRPGFEEWKKGSILNQ